MADLIQATERGLYCRAGDFHIDPWQPVARAVITHAHSDHARWGSELYYTSAAGASLLRLRLGASISLQPLEYREPIDINGVQVSLHPAGHLLGSAQVRVERDGEVWVASGDYKLHADPTCAPHEAVRCDVFITESTFGLPIYRWRPPQAVFDEINGWWRENQQRRRNSIMFAYSLGKAQRVLAGLDATIGPIIVHGAVARLVDAYAAAGVNMPPVRRAEPDLLKQARGQAMVIAPPSALASPWLRRFGKFSTAMASGWMQVRGTRRRRNVDRGFVLSDHADWPGLLRAIESSGARRILVTHGFTEPFSRWLNESGWNAQAIRTRFSDSGEEEMEPVEE